MDVPGKPATEDPEEWLFNPIETQIAPHHLLMMQAAERVMNTPHGRVMMFFPPGSAKSTYCSVVLPAYIMGKRPGYRLILASYGTDLARKQGRRARQIVKSSAYRAIFETELSNESSAADEWALTNGSEYMAGSFQSGITGNRANGIIIDDPVKGREEADSPVVRQRTLESWQDDVKSRIIPGAWVLLIQTRWNEDDLAGSILPENWNGESGLIRCRDGMDWEIICVPAKCDRPDDPLHRKIGEYLWPQWFDRKHWAQFESVPRTWSALYQQKPAPEEGNFFKADWIRRYDKRPARDTLKIYGGSDYAVTSDGGDYTSHVVVGIDPAGRMYLLDLWRSQASSDVWITAFCDLVKRWRPLAWAEETGQIRSAIGPALEKQMRERQAYVIREKFPTRGDKAVRAQSIRARMGLEGLYVPRDNPALKAPWADEFIHELLVFPAGRNDDQVDALGLVGQLLDIMLKGKDIHKVSPIRGAHEMTMDELVEASKQRSRQRA